MRIFSVGPTAVNVQARFLGVYDVLGRYGPDSNNIYVRLIEGSS